MKKWEPCLSWACVQTNDECPCVGSAVAAELAREAPALGCVRLIDSCLCSPKSCDPPCPALPFPADTCERAPLPSSP